MTIRHNAVMPSTDDGMIGNTGLMTIRRQESDLDGYSG